MGRYGEVDAKLIVKKLTVKDKMPVTYTVAKTVVQATGAIISNWNINSAGTGAQRTATGFSEYPPYACKLSVTANAVGTAGGSEKIRFRGYTAQGKFVQEDVSVQATAAGRNYTNYAYAKLTSLKTTPAGIVAPKSTSVAIGYNPVTVGVPYFIAATSDFLTLNYDGTYATTSGTASGTGWKVSKQYQTVTLSTTAAGKGLSMVYLSKVQA